LSFFLWQIYDALPDKAAELKKEKRFFSLFYLF